MRSFTFDIETDGLLDKLTHVKCLNVIDNESGERMRFTDNDFYLDARTGLLTDVPTKRQGTIQNGLDKLAQAGRLCGQNIVAFDLPALRQVYGFEFKGETFDTKTISMMLFPDLRDRDFIAHKKGKIVMPPELMGAHKLASWGIRLGQELKADFNPASYGEWTWENYPFSVECDDYCMQDVVANVVLVKHFEKRIAELQVPTAALELEHTVARIIAQQTDYGWSFDSKAAEKLTVELMQEKIDLEASLVKSFGEFFVRDGSKTAVTKKSARRFVESELGSETRKFKGVEQRGWFAEFVEGVEHQKVKLVRFNPGSRAHIANRLTKLYQWEPSEFTPNGQAQVDEAILGQLVYPEAQALSKFFRTTKVLGQVSEGDNAYLKCVRADGRIHGSVNPCGAVTARMTHSNPNVAQADGDPRVRGLFVASQDYVLVGTDADSLELRCLAHFLAKYDGGEYTTVVLSGRKEDGTDMHTRNMRSCSLTQRECAKRVFYAWLYGAGNFKLGTVVYSEDWDDAKRARFNARYQGDARKAALARIGKRVREALVAGINGADKLIEAVQKASARGYLKGLDGRRIQCRSQHAALNTLLQSAGALIMKKALALADATFTRMDLVHGEHYGYVGNIHDEIQIESQERYANFIGQTMAESIRLAGSHFAFRCPLAGNFAVGKSWADTH